MALPTKTIALDMDKWGAIIEALHHREKGLLEELAGLEYASLEPYVRGELARMEAVQNIINREIYNVGKVC